MAKAKKRNEYFPFQNGEMSIQEKEMLKKVKKYIVRCNRAGVFYGEIAKREGQDVTMRNVRKLWYWDGACAVEELAKNGTTAPDNCKFTVAVDEMTVIDPVQILPVTEKAAKSLDAVKEWRRG